MKWNDEISTELTLPAEHLLRKNSARERSLQKFLQHCKKGFVIVAIIFFTRVATVYMVLWNDTRIVPCDSQVWAIWCTWSSYKNNWICYKGRLFRHQVSAICSKRALFLTKILAMWAAVLIYTICAQSKFPIPIVAIPSYSVLKGCTYIIVP